jgi:hypothetical protein
MSTEPDRGKTKIASSLPVTSSAQIAWHCQIARHTMELTPIPLRKMDPPRLVGLCEESNLDGELVFADLRAYFGALVPGLETMAARLLAQAWGMDGAFDVGHGGGDEKMWERQRDETRIMRLQKLWRRKICDEEREVERSSIGTVRRFGRGSGNFASSSRKRRNKFLYSLRSGASQEDLETSQVPLGSGETSSFAR